jgi:putative spermidine/putrescine transport system ATP-binding protein
MRIAFTQLRIDMPGHRALDDVAGEVASGSVTAVIGPSGAGKSSLLGAVAGLVRPDAGRVTFDGDDVTDWAPERRRLGVVFQDLRLFDFMSGRDNVAFAPRVAGLAADEQRRRVGDAIALVRAGGFADRPARVLSGGERQRIALARALAMAPRALLLDEPFAALDAELRRRLRDELRALIHQLGMTVLLVTHDRDDAFALASRFIVLRDGRVEQAGDATTLYEAPASEFVATLLGEATLLPIEERRDGKALVHGEWIEVIGDGNRVLLRPESLSAADSGARGWAATVTDARFTGGRWRIVARLANDAALILHAATMPSSASVTVRPPARAHTVV